MAASQARLLTLTSRLHDVELKAQNLQAQKIALATQKDGVYQEYCDALDAKAFKINLGTNGEKLFVDANFNSLCNYHEGVPRNYALLDNRTGKILVNQNTADKYKQYGSDKYAFAFAMMGIMPNNNDYSRLGQDINIDDDEYNNGVNDDDGDRDITVNEADAIINRENNPNIATIYAMTKVEKEIYDDLINSGNDYSTLKSKYEAFNSATDPKEQKKAYADFRKELMKQAADKIFEKLASDCNKDGAEWDKAEFNHYTQLWDAIQEAGGYQVIDAQYEGGDDGTEWFKNAVESGNVTIRSYGESGHANEWSDTSFATSTNSNWLQEVNDDTMEKKAEAKYKHELDIINRKDTHFDTELKKLETERTAITKELDSIKQVKDDNIDRTFGLFS